MLGCDTRAADLTSAAHKRASPMTSETSNPCGTTSNANAAHDFADLHAGFTERSHLHPRLGHGSGAKAPENKRLRHLRRDPVKLP